VRVDKLLQNELFIRLFSLVVAILVYMVSQGAGANVERVVTGVPVNTAGLGAGMVASSIRPATVAVTVTGSAAVVNALDTTKLSASVNLSAAKSGDRTYFVQVSIPPGLQYVATTPADISVVVEPISNLEEAVQVDTSGTPAPGFGTSGTPSVQPAVVVITGAASAVQQVVRAAVTVPVDSASAPVTVQATVVAEDANHQPVTGVQVSPAEVEVTVPVTPVVPEKTVPVEAQLSGQPAPGYSLAGASVSPAQVTVLGPQAALDALQTVSAEPVAVDGATGTVKLDVGVIQPPGVTAVNPSEVTVTVTIAKSK